MRKILFSILLLVIFSICLAQANGTERVYLSGRDAASTIEWDFYCTDGMNSGKWSKIKVPSNWELQGFGNYNYGHDWKNQSIKLGKEHGMYKFQFDAKKEWKGKTIEIVFEGSMTDTKVKINGKSAGEMHQGGFNPFKYDITNLINFGEKNLLEVDVAKHSANQSVNKAEREADFWIFGGIYRPVYLEISPKIHIDRAAINAKHNGEFESLVVLSDVVNKGELTCQIYTTSMQKVGDPLVYQFSKNEKEAKLKGAFPSIQSWNPESPNLYIAKYSLLENGKVIHERTEKFGFRTVELRVKDGFYVNGKKVVFKGVNRHSFWPETGRSLSEKNHLEDIKLMKEMNMNAVRMSHYQPDKRFLELCDSLGLFVFDELTGWQDGYDTIVGPKLIKELVLYDENHPSVVVWDHGNEGGWNFANEKWFHYYDIQKRPVLYPWLHRNGVDTKHYISYDFGINRFTNGSDVFMPTEFLHGMYDGGIGAGLADFWQRFSKNPRFAGGFLWVFADEAVLRTDKPGKYYDPDGHHAADGILGPHREKEASFYTVKKIWSPVQVEPLVVNKFWDGTLRVRNEYLFTNLNRCSFSWEILKSNDPSAGTKVNKIASGKIKAPEALPGETRNVAIDVKDELQNGDIFTFTALNEQGEVINTWSWPILQPKELNETHLENVKDEHNIVLNENGNTLIATVNNLMFSFNSANGHLETIKKNGQTISFTGGPTPVGLKSNINKVDHCFNAENNLEIAILYDSYPHKVVWELNKNGLLKLTADPIKKDLKEIEYLGIGFKYPELNCKSIKWLGNGPYRVWKNRLDGTNFGVWEKEYNNTITGESFENLIYPEFKGYHSNVYWAEFRTSEGNFTVFTETSNLFAQFFTPDNPQFIKGGSVANFPETDISFLYEISAIGTKFKTSDQLGPSGLKGSDYYNEGQDNDPIILWFDFR